ncbi:MAG: hypothetical protein CMK59_00510 [Proteobacteria bacterium]|nr:hypothetical protein [Pseudomonadota bacterium]
MLLSLHHHSAQVVSDTNVKKIELLDTLKIHSEVHFQGKSMTTSAYLSHLPETSFACSLIGCHTEIDFKMLLSRKLLCSYNWEDINKALSSYALFVVMDWTPRQDSFLHLLQYSKLLTIGPSSSARPTVSVANNSNTKTPNVPHQLAPAGLPLPLENTAPSIHPFFRLHPEQLLSNRKEDIEHSLPIMEQALEPLLYIAQGGTIPYNTPVEALFALGELSKISSPHTRYRCSLARAELYLSWGASNYALHLLDQSLLAGNPFQSLIHSTMARALTFQGNIHAAAQSWTRSMEIAKERNNKELFSFLCYRRAQTALNREDRLEAELWLERFLESPGTSEAQKQQVRPFYAKIKEKNHHTPLISKNASDFEQMRHALWLEWNATKKPTINELKELKNHALKANNLLWHTRISIVIAVFEQNQTLFEECCSLLLKQGYCSGQLQAQWSKHMDFEDIHLL